MDTGSRSVAPEVVRWRSMLQQIAAVRENTLREIDELVQENAYWLCSMQAMMRNHGNASAASNLSSSAATTGNAPLEHASLRMRRACVVLFTLWTLANRSLNRALQQQHRLLTKLALAVLLQNMSMHHSQVSRALLDTNIESETSHDASIDDLKSITSLAESISMLLNERDLWSVFCCSASTSVPRQSSVLGSSSVSCSSEVHGGQVPSRAYHESSRGNSEGLPNAAFPHLQSVAVFESPVSREMPMPRFGSSLRENSVEESLVRDIQDAGHMSL